MDGSDRCPLAHNVDNKTRDIPDKKENNTLTVKKIAVSDD
jgi:hypothetical protein